MPSLGLFPGAVTVPVFTLTADPGVSPALLHNRKPVNPYWACRPQAARAYIPSAQADRAGLPDGADESIPNWKSGETGQLY